MEEEAMKWWDTRIEPVPNANYATLELEGLVELTRSYDGYQREAAVAELVRRAEPQAIAALLVCSGDWVWQVSRAARQALAIFMREEFVAHWAQALPELAFAYRVRRTDLRDLLEAIEAFLARNVEALERHAPSPDSWGRRWMFSLRLNQPLTEQALLELLHRGIGTSDLPIARLCLKAAGRLQEPSHRLEVLEAASRSRLPRVRIAALRELLAAADLDEQPFAHAMCMDSSAAIRALAVGALTEGREELARRAKHILQQPASNARLCVCALHVLSLLGDPQALVFARELSASSPVVALRRLARWLVLSATPAEAIETELIETLADESPKVRRLAVEHIRRGAFLPSPEALMRLVLERRQLTIDVRDVLRIGSPWDWLLFILELLESEVLMAELAEAMTDELHSWSRAMTQCYVQPQATQRTRLARLWTQRARLLPHGLLKQTEVCLRQFHVI
jgi:hypothetical protein